MKKTALTLLLACLLSTGCVSLKKYKLLEADYQRCGEDQKSYEQLQRIEECEKMDRERLKKEVVMTEFVVGIKY